MAVLVPAIHAFNIVIAEVEAIVVLSKPKATPNKLLPKPAEAISAKPICPLKAIKPVVKTPKAEATPKN